MKSVQNEKCSKLKVFEMKYIWKSSKLKVFETKSVKNEKCSKLKVLKMKRSKLNVQNE